MTRFVLRLVLISITVLSPGLLPAQTKDALPLATVISQVKKELAAAQNTPGQNAGLALQSVQIVFALTQTTDANGKVAIGVPIISADLGANGDRKAETGSTLTVELAPPTASVTMSGVDASQFGITQAILSTRKQLAEGLNDEPKLDPTKVSLQFKFGITRTGGGTAQIKFLIFTVGGGVTKSDTETSTITLNFAKK
jgi:hypothetical protein